MREEQWFRGEEESRGRSRAERRAELSLEKMRREEEQRKEQSRGRSRAERRAELREEQS